MLVKSCSLVERILAHMLAVVENLAQDNDCIPSSLDLHPLYAVVTDFSNWTALLILVVLSQWDSVLAAKMLGLDMDSSQIVEMD